MGILDELRKEAREKKLQEETRKAFKQEQEAAYQTRVLPVMQSIFTYLQETLEYLRVVDEVVEIASYSDRFPQLGCLSQRDYKINTDGYSGFADFNRLMQINLTFFCSNDGSFSYQIENKGSIEQEVAFLHAKGVPFQWKYIKGKERTQTASITITRKIPVRFRFEVDYQQAAINILINNHEDFAVYKKSFQPEQIDEAFLDKLVRYLLRRDSEFIRLEISDAKKRRIRKTLEQIQREESLLREQIKREFQAEHQASEKKRISGRLKALLKRDKD